jgi:hypothetical protein
MKRALLDAVPANRLSELFSYEPETGFLYWKERAQSWFPDRGHGGAYGCMRRWNADNANRRAFTAKDGPGYHWGAIKGIRCKAHQVVWALHNGEWALEQIDHVNGIRTDNRIENLRAVSHRENARNAKIYRSNKSGTPGVSWHKRDQIWIARINTTEGRLALGSYRDLADAVRARKSAEIAHGYHPNHGRAA